jgi:hypothetical protein
MQHTIAGDWFPADNSKARIELAETEDRTPKGEPFIALRNSVEPDREPTFVTPTQVRELVGAYEGGKLSRLLGSRKG